MRRSIHCGWGPKENLQRTAGRYRLKKCVSVFDAGSFCPVYDEADTVTVPVACVSASAKASSGVICYGLKVELGRGRRCGRPGYLSNGESRISLWAEMFTLAPNSPLTHCRR
ncbi:MAG: hypothetical protein ACLSWV_01220 [Pygmaiobacter massiliensis]